MTQACLSGTSGRRKSQNAAAQRTYRAKQRQKINSLERFAAAALAKHGSSLGLPSELNPLHPDVGDVESLQSFGGSSVAADSAAIKRVSPAGTPLELILPDIFAAMSIFSETERDKCYRILVRENFGLRDMIRYGLIILGYAVDSDLFNQARGLPADTWIKLVLSKIGYFDCRMAVFAFLNFLAGLNEPVGPKREGQSIQEVADPYMNHMSLSIMSYGAAIAENARHLQISVEDIIDDYSVSPYYIRKSAPVAGQPITFITTTTALTCNEKGDMEQGGCLGPRQDNIKPDLLSMPAQRNIPHHPCYDILPWPTFRARAIMAVSADPPLIDEEDLCLDLFHDGIRCWGSSGGSLHGRGQGAPWDSRSWEAAPWFLKKWECLAGGKDGEMWRNSAWWRSMRGETGSMDT